MAADHRTGRTAHSRERASGRRHPGRTRATRRALGRVPRPLACALAVACAPLALHLATPWVAGTLPGSGTESGPTATAYASPTATDSTAPEPAGASPAHSAPGSTAPHAPRPADGTARATASVSSAPADAPLDPSWARPAKISWVLRADRLVLRGARFRGVVTVRTAAGTVRALKLTVRSLDAVDLDLTAGRGRAAMRLRAGPATTSTLRGQGADGVVTLYVRTLSGTVTALGAGPLPAARTVTITPDAVPDWLSHPVTPTRTITLVAATASQITQSGGRLSLTGPQLRAAAG
ncbi:hypothetical protein ACH47Z_20570 [Streptomyces sp. NPDC020192]|uniref:hypothetical protein n=1 Tax=Streptomyces sp. NPDC020192 TaxID=3365066 RepID=UPI0037AA1B1B